MAATPSIPTQIAAIAESARRLRILAGGPLPLLDDQMYLRPVPQGCTVISCDPGYRPQQGLTRPWGPPADLQALKAALQKTLAERDSQEAQGARETRVTPDKALQSVLIRDAIRNQGRMLALASACAERPTLHFLADEMPLREPDGTKTVCDLLALRCEGDLGIPVAIELKSSRQLKRLTEQVHRMAGLLHEHRDAFQAFAEACLGRAVRLATTAERWIVWPSAGPDRHGDLDPRAEKCRAEQVRVITYAGKPEVDLVLHASTP